MAVTTTVVAALQLLLLVVGLTTTTTTTTTAAAGFLSAAAVATKQQQRQRQPSLLYGKTYSSPTLLLSSPSLIGLRGGGASFLSSSKLPTPSAPSTSSLSLSTASSSAIPSDDADDDGDGEVVPRGGGGASSSSAGTATIPNEVFNLIKSIAGAGFLSLPWGVAVFGNAPSALIPAVVLIAITGALSGYTFGLIGRVCSKTKTASYADAWDVVVGKRLAWLIAFSCLVDCFAGNLTYSMILADTIKNLLSSIGVSVTRTQSLLSVTAVVLLPLCLLKNLASLAPFSLVGIIGMLYTTVVMGIRWFGKAYQVGGTYYDTQLTPPVFGTAGARAALSPKALVLACMLSNAYIAHFNAPKFLTELKNPTMKRFHQVIGWSFGVSVALYGIVTGFGFLTFGAASNGLILNNYSTADLLASFSRIAVALSITFSYPLIFVGTRDALMDLFNVKQQDRSNKLLNQMTLAILGVVTLLAAKLTDLGLVASISGATFGTALVFIYPAIMFLKSQKAKTVETIPAALIGVLGIIMSVVGTVLSVQGP